MFSKISYLLIWNMRTTIPDGFLSMKKKVTKNGEKEGRSKLNLSDTSFNIWAGAQYACHLCSFPPLRRRTAWLLRTMFDFANFTLIKLKGLGTIFRLDGHTRVCVGRKFTFDWGGMCNLAFIAATILNFGLAQPAWPSQPKIQNCGSNEC